MAQPLSPQSAAAAAANASNAPAPSASAPATSMAAATARSPAADSIRSAAPPHDSALNTDKECSCWQSFVNGLKCFGQAIEAVCTMIWQMIVEAWNSMIACCYPKKDDTATDTANKAGGTLAKKPDSQPTPIVLEGETPRPRTAPAKTASEPHGPSAISGGSAQPHPSAPTPDAPSGAAPSPSGAASRPAKTPEPSAAPPRSTPRPATAPASASGASDLIAAAGAPLAPPPAAAAGVPFLAAPLSDVTVAHINFVIDTSAAAQQSNWGAMSLLPKQKELTTRGAEIAKVLHPLEFFAYQLINKRAQVIDIRRTNILGGRFVADWAKDLMQRPNLQGHLDAFYAYMNVADMHRVRLQGLANGRNWEGFYDHCLHNNLTVNPTGVPAN